MAHIRQRLAALRASRRAWRVLWLLSWTLLALTLIGGVIAIWRPVQLSASRQLSRPTWGRGSTLMLSLEDGRLSLFAYHVSLQNDENEPWDSIGPTYITDAESKASTAPLSRRLLPLPLWEGSIDTGFPGGFGFAALGLGFSALFRHPGGQGFITMLQIHFIYPLTLSLLGLFTARRKFARLTAEPNAVPCPHCGYDLRASTGGHCPECGAIFVLASA